METFAVNNVDTVIVVGLTVFSSFFGIFYYLLLVEVYKLNFRIKWPLFAIPPFIVLLTAAIDNRYVPFSTLMHMPLIALLMLCIPIYKTLVKKEGTHLELFLYIFGIPIAMIIGPWSIALIIVCFIFKDIIKPDKTTTFHELQRILPTSKIRSLAMGLVEVQGRTKMLEPVTSRIKKDPCIGYLYRVDRIRKDKNGKKSYTNIKTETVCNSFNLTDDTGTILVSAEDISLIDFPESPHSYESNGKRYQLFLLLENMSVLLIGKAVNQKRKIMVQKDDGKKLLGISPYDRVQRWNLYRPLRQSALRHAIVLALVLLPIATCDFRFADNKIFVTFPSLYEFLPLSEELQDFFKNYLQ